MDSSLKRDLEHDPAWNARTAGEEGQMPLHLVACCVLLMNEFEFDRDSPPLAPQGRGKPYSCTMGDCATWYLSYDLVSGSVVSTEEGASIFNLLSLVTK